MAKNLVNLGSGTGFVPDSTKPLSESIFTYDFGIDLRNFQKECWRYQPPT